MTTSQPADDVSSSTPVPSGPAASRRPGADPVSRRLAEMEARLDLLEGETGPSASVSSRLSRRLDALEAREHYHAQAVAHLEGRLATLQANQLDLQEAAGGTQGDVTAPPSQAGGAVFPPRPKRSLARRALDGLHYLRYVWRRLQGHEDGAFPDQSLKETVGEDVQDVPSLGLVVLCEDDAVDTAALQAALERQTAVGLPYVVYYTQSRRLGDTSGGVLLDSSNAEAASALRQAPLDYLVSLTLDDLQQWPPTLAECLQLSLAVEDLDVLEVLLSPTLRVLAVRPKDWQPHRAVPKARLGKTVDLSSAPVASLLDRQFDRRMGPYRFSKAGTALTRHRLVPSDDPAPSQSGPPLVLTDDLLQGREQLFSDLFLRLGPSPWVLVGEDDALTRQRLGQLQRLRRLDGAAPQIYALGTLIPEPLRSGAVRWLARRWGSNAVIPLSLKDSESLSQERPSQTIAAGLSQDLPIRQPPSRHGSLLCASTLGTESLGGSAALDAMRRQLGWQDKRPVVLWFGDLLPPRRPEEFLALAHRCRQEAAFLMVGRGPLEGSIDDLAGFLDLGHFRRLPSLPLSFALGLSQVLCATGPDEPLPYTLLGALESGQSLLLAEGSELARSVVAEGRGRTFTPGDPDAASAALRALLRGGDQVAEVAPSTTPESADSISLWPSLEDVDSAWRDCLGTPKSPGL